MRHHRLFSLLLLTTSLLSPNLSAAAEAINSNYDEANSWQYYLSYHNATQAVAAGNVVYSLFNGHLLVYDAEANHSITVDRMSAKLSGSIISQIGWSTTQKCLVAVYTDNNIDLIYPEKGDGTTGLFDIVNLPQLKNYTEDNITIKRLNVFDDYATIITTKGVIVLNLTNETVQGYYQIGTDLVDAIVCDKHVYVARPTNVICGQLTDNLFDSTQWQTALASTAVKYFVGSNAGIYASTSAGVELLNRNDDGSITTQHVNSSPMTTGSANGKYVQFATTNRVLTLSADRPTEIVQDIRGSFSPQSVVRTANGSLLLAEGEDGLRKYDISTSTSSLPTPTEVVGNFGPRHSDSYGLLIDHGRLFVTGGIPADDVEGFVGMYDGTNWSDMDEDRARTEPSRDGRLRNFYYSLCHTAVDPRDPNHVMVSSFKEGIYEYQDGKFVKLYNADNSSLTSANPGGSERNSYVYTGGVTYDADGNLWITNNYDSNALLVYRTDGQWQKVSMGDGDKLRRMERIMFDSKGHIWVNARMTTRSSASGVVAMNYSGSLATVDGDLSVFRNTAYNEDGTECSLSGAKIIVEDNEGQIWIGCNTGIYAVTNSDDWFNTNSFSIYQPKVPRNDGTNYADYLLTGNTVNAIAVDGGNRKWIGTLGSGIYLVNPDGSEIIKHFDTTNSPLLSDNIYEMAIDPESGRLYISTDCGLCSYETGVTPVQPTLSKDNIKIYPNPVRPEYSGSVTINGLTADGEVKVISTGSQLVARGTAVGGAWQWDLTQQSTGQRVAPGVYYIMISTADGKKSVAGKVVVI